MKKIDNNVLTALLGVVLGVLIAMVTFKMLPEKKFDGDYDRWRKLNRILQEVQKNYVDTIDMAGMTDAAVVAALAAVYGFDGMLKAFKLLRSDERAFFCCIFL